MKKNNTRTAVCRCEWTCVDHNKSRVMISDDVIIAVRMILVGNIQNQANPYQHSNQVLLSYVNAAGCHRVLRIPSAAASYHTTRSCDTCETLHATSTSLDPWLDRWSVSSGRKTKKTAEALSDTRRLLIIVTQDLILPLAVSCHMIR